MTVQTANRTVLDLVGFEDYHSAQSALVRYYNIAQKQIATTVCPIIRTAVLSAGVNPLPDDLYRIKCVDGTYTRNGDTVITYGKEPCTLTYYAYPAELTDESSLFDIDPEAQPALAYYAAAQAVIADSDMRRYNAFMDSYNNILANIAAANKWGNVRVVTL